MASITNLIRGSGRDYFDRFTTRAGANVKRAGELLDEMLAGFPDTQGLADDILACERDGDEIALAVPLLRSFRDISEHTLEVHRLENAGDRIVRGAIASLFEAGIDPMAVIRWKDVFERLEQAIDATERAADILEGIVIKNA